MTVSLPSDVIAEAERWGPRLGASTRSAVVEKALRMMVKKLREDELTRELDDYYLGQTDEEREEDGALFLAFRRLRKKIDLDAAPRRRSR